MLSDLFLFPGRLCLNKANEWKPLLLIVPLRLGLTEINPIYVNGIKVRIILFPI